MTGIACGMRGAMAAAIARQVVTVGDWPDSPGVFLGYGSAAVLGASSFGAMNDVNVGSYTINQVTKLTGNPFVLGMYPDNAPANLFARLYIQTASGVLVALESAAAIYTPSAATSSGNRSLWQWEHAVSGAIWTAADIGSRRIIQLAF